MSLTAANVFGLFMIFVGLASICYTLYWLLLSGPRCPQCRRPLRAWPRCDCTRDAGLVGDDVSEHW